MREEQKLQEWLKQFPYDFRYWCDGDLPLHTEVMIVRLHLTSSGLGWCRAQAGIFCNVMEKWNRKNWRKMVFKLKLQYYLITFGRIFAPDGGRVTATETTCSQSERRHQAVKTWELALHSSVSAQLRPETASEQSSVSSQLRPETASAAQVSDSVVPCHCYPHLTSTNSSRNQWSEGNIYRESHQFLLHWPDRIFSDNILLAPDAVTSPGNQVNIS